MKDKTKTEMMFRKEKSGDFKGVIFVIMPYELADIMGNVMSYQTVGQHSAVTYDIAMKHSVPAKPKEFKELKKELEDFYDYNIKIIHRRNFKKYNDAFNKILNNG